MTGGAMTLGETGCVHGCLVPAVVAHLRASYSLQNQRADFLTGITVATPGVQASFPKSQEGNHSGKVRPCGVANLTSPYLNPVVYMLRLLQLVSGWNYYGSRFLLSYRKPAV